MSSTYGYRTSELRDLLAQVPAAANDEINQNFTNLISSYADLRQRAMDDLVDLMAKASASNLGTQSKWQSRIARLRSDYQDLFKSATTEVMLPPAHQLFLTTGWSTSVGAEEKFFETLSKVVTPQRMDDLLQHQDNLTKAFGALEDTWNFILSKNDAYSNEEMGVVQDLDKTAQEIVTELDSNWNKVKDAFWRWDNTITGGFEKAEEQLKRLPGAELVEEEAKKQAKDYITSLLPEGKEIEWELLTDGLKYLKLWAEVYTGKARTYHDVIEKYQDLVNEQKESVLPGVIETRHKVDEYLRSNGIDQAQNYLKQAKDALNDWISSLPTSRQRDDGTMFRDNINQKLDIVFKRTQDIDSQFKSKFQGELLSSLSDITIEKLAQSYLFKQQFDKIKDRDVAGKLGDIEEQLSEQVNRSDENLGNLVDSVSSIDGLPDEVQDVVRSMTRDFRAYVRDRIKTEIDGLLEQIEALKKLMVPSHLDQDLNRQELESMLN